MFCLICAKFGTRLTNFNRVWPSLRRFWPDVGQIWPDLVNTGSRWPTSAESGQHRARLGPDRRTDLPVPLDVLHNELYEERAPAYAALAFSSVGRWRDAKCAIKAAAKTARRHLSSTDDTNEASEDGVLRSLSGPTVARCWPHTRQFGWFRPNSDQGLSISGKGFRQRQESVGVGRQA